MVGVKLKNPREVALVDLPMPKPKQGEALIAVRAAGICGSDIGAYRGTNPLVSYPRVIGHEIAGEVLAIGENSRSLQCGDRVILDPYLYCGDCYPCSIGRTNCCENLQVLGVHCDGGMAAYICHPAEMLVKVPDDMPWEYIPLAEPLTIALHGLHRAELRAGEHILINGAGPIGLLAVMAARHYGAVPIVSDPVDARLDFAMAHGAAHGVNPLKEDLVERVRSLTAGRMAEVVMEASGAAAAVVSVFDTAANAGRVILTGWPKEPIPLDTGKITKKELDVRGARTSTGEFEEAVELIDTGKVDAKAVLSSVVPVGEVPGVIQDIDRFPDRYMKVNVIFGE